MRSCDILTYSLYGGDATSHHTFELARTLTAMGIRPAVYSNFSPHDLPPDIRPIGKQASFASYMSAADLTILQYPLWFPLAERFRKAAAARIFWYHGVTPPEHWPVAGERDLLRTSETRTELANHADIAVAASPFTAAELHRHSGVPVHRIHIVPLGVDVERFALTPDQAQLGELRRRWKLDGKRILLYVGRIAGNKRIDLLIEALAALAHEQPALHLLAIGDDRSGIATQVLVDDLRTLARERGVAHRVTFTGRVPDVAPYYHLADVFALPSEHEGFGVPLVEAMAAGTPVVASASGAMPWLLGADGGESTSGLLFPPGNVKELTTHLNALLTDAVFCEVMADRGRRRAQKFNRQAFRVRAALVIAKAIELHAAGVVPPAQVDRDSVLRANEDTMLRDYTVSSQFPLVGKRIAQLRTASTVHFKEAYFDRVMEQQVSFNRALAGAIDSLSEKLTERAESTSKARRP